MQLPVQSFLCSFICFVGLNTFGQEIEASLHPDDQAVIDKIAQFEQLDAPAKPNPTGWPRVPAAHTVRYSSSSKAAHALTVGYNESGRVTHLVGNGPLLCNDAFGWIAALPELMLIRIDHNTPKPSSERSLELYDGAGIVALKDSKLEELKIGHAFDDDGMAALAQLKSLRSVTLVHSRVTDAGVANLAGHPKLREFSISSQARPNRVTEKCLTTFATLAQLQRLGIQETFVTYDNGFKHLKPLQGQLKSISLKMTLVLPADLAKIKADHPGVEIETSTVAEILENPNARGVKKWASPEAIEYLNGAEVSVSGVP